MGRSEPRRPVRWFIVWMCLAVVYVPWVAFASELAEVIRPGRHMPGWLFGLYMASMFWFLK